MAIMDRKKPGTGELDGYIGPGTVIEGTVRFTQVLRVDGKVSGKIVSERDLVIGDEGVVDAEVEVGSISVDGKLSGKITVSERMEIHSGAEVRGEIQMKSPSLVIEEGGVFEGKVKMSTGVNAEVGIPVDAVKVPVTKVETARAEVGKGDAEPIPETGKMGRFSARSKLSPGGRIS